MRYHVIGLPEGKMKVKKNVVSTAPTLMISWVGTKSLKMYLLCSEIQNIALFSTFANIYIGLNSLNDKPKKKSIKDHERKNSIEIILIIQFCCFCFMTFLVWHRFTNQLSCQINPLMF